MKYTPMRCEVERLHQNCPIDVVQSSCTKNQVVWGLSFQVRNQIGSKHFARSIFLHGVDYRCVVLRRASFRQGVVREGTPKPGCGILARGSWHWGTVFDHGSKEQNGRLWRSTYQSLQVPLPAAIWHGPMELLGDRTSNGTSRQVTLTSPLTA